MVTFYLQTKTKIKLIVRSNAVVNFNSSKVNNKYGTMNRKKSQRNKKK